MENKYQRKQTNLKFRGDTSYWRNYRGPSAEDIAIIRQKEINKGKEEARIGRVFAWAENGKCFVGTITSTFKNHFLVVTRKGTKVKVDYSIASKTEAFTTFEEWDAIAKKSGAQFLD